MSVAAVSTCRSCGRPGMRLRPSKTLGRVCSSCAERARAEPCASCGVSRPPRRRLADGRGLCTVCVQRDVEEAGRDRSRQVIIDAVGRAEPLLPPETVAAAIAVACPTTWHLTKLAAAFAADPDALVTGRSGAPVEADRLAATLRSAGATRIAAFVCSRCGQSGRCARVSGGQAICDRCGAHRRDRCSSCATIKAVAVVWAAGPVCSTCYQRALAAKGTCEDCGARRRIDPRDSSGRQRCSDCAGLAAFAICDGCGVEDRIWRRRRCFACNLADRVGQLLAEADGTVRVELSGLAAALVDTTSPRAVLRWLEAPVVADTLAGLAQRRIEASHEALDALGAGRAVAHLRHVLISAGVLPARDETLAGLHDWVEAQLDRIEVVEDRNLVAAYATWWVLRRRRERLARRPTLQVGYDHRNLLRAIELLGWLRAHDSSLGSCTQAHIDLWLASGPPSRRDADRFVRWARRRRLCAPIVIARQPAAMPVAAREPTALAGLARRLLADDTIALPDRVAGLLVILYGQTATRIAALNLDHINHRDAITTLALGSTPVELPEPLAQLVRQLATSRHGRPALGGDPGRWLFPGGRPGRPITASRLSVRLNKLGIDVRAARTTMLIELSGELIPAVIADTLGLSPGTATRWVRAAAGDWNAYAASRASGPTKRPLPGCTPHNCTPAAGSTTGAG